MKMSTSALLTLAAAIVWETSESKKGTQHPDLEPAILQAASEGGFRREVKQRALAAIKLFTNDENGNAVQLGKPFTESFNSYAIDKVKENAGSRVAALLFTAGMTETGKTVAKGLAVKSVNQVTDQLNATTARLKKEKNKVSELRTMVPRKKLVKSNKVVATKPTDTKSASTLNPQAAWPFPLNSTASLGE